MFVTIVLVVMIAVNVFIAGFIVGRISSLPKIELTDWYDDFGWTLPEDVQELCEKYGWQNIVENWG
jgi:hypothetical protein